LYHANLLGSLAVRSAGVDCLVGGLRVAERRPLRLAIERRAVRRMRRVVCVSEGVARFAHDVLRCDRSRIVVIPNGVNVDRLSSGDRFDWSRLGWPGDSRVVLFVGRMHVQKGIELLREQVDRLAPPNSDRRLLLVGDGPLQGVVDDWIRTVGNRVQRLPWQRDVGSLIRSARVLVLPSRYEGMPNVVMEAMAAGRPVVCSQVEGIAELLSHAPERQSFPVGDGAAMVTRVDAFDTDDDLCREIGRQNQQRMRDEFSIPAMVDAYRSLYRSLIER
jgi:starch synthase (maltosyl-transferring)